MLHATKADLAIGSLKQPLCVDTPTSDFLPLNLLLTSYLKQPLFVDTGGDGDLDPVSSNKAVESASCLDTAGVPLAHGLTFADYDGELGRLLVLGAIAPGGESCGSAGGVGAGGPGGSLLGGLLTLAAAAAVFLMVHLVRMLFLPGILAMHMSTGALRAAQVRAMSVHISADDAHVQRISHVGLGTCMASPTSTSAPTHTLPIPTCPSPRPHCQ